MEVWKDVKGFAGVYKVSDMGNVVSCDRLVNHYLGGKRFYKGRSKKLRIDKNGYLRTCLKKDGNRFDKRVHRLVCESFLDYTKIKTQVNHINGIKNDNRLENLEWCTPSENIVHAVKSGLIKKKLTNNEAMNIFNSKKTNRKLSAEYGISSCVIWRIKNKKAYKHIFI